MLVQFEKYLPPSEGKSKFSPEIGRSSCAHLEIYKGHMSSKGEGDELQDFSFVGRVGSHEKDTGSTFQSFLSFSIRSTPL